MIRACSALDHDVMTRLGLQIVPRKPDVWQHRRRQLRSRGTEASVHGDLVRWQDVLRSLSDRAREARAREGDCSEPRGRRGRFQLEAS